MSELKLMINKIKSWGKQYNFFRKNLKYFRFHNEFIIFSQMQSKERFLLSWNDRYPFLEDKTNTTPFDAHYIYHPAWAARIIAEIHPAVHIDISSSLNFCTIVSAFVPVDFYDYRPVKLTLSGLNCRRADLLNLPFQDNSVDSISCMHVIEHIGLGRYGDLLDPDGDLKAISELVRVLSKGGSLLFVIPVGKPKIRFNAHRIYSYEQITSYFSGLRIEEFALVDDNGKFVPNVDPSIVDKQNYGCGCWWFKK
jgi:SAM-dependent methyltransferase